MCGEDKSCGCATLEIVEEPEAVTAGGLAAEATDVPDKWHAVLTVEGLRTTDHRRIAPMALTWRQLPLALFAQFNNAGHAEAPIVGQITKIERDDASGHVTAEGTFDLDLEDGRQAARMCANGTLRWGSVDLEVMESRYVEVSTGGEDADVLDMLFDEVPSEAGDWYDEVIEGRIMGHTMIATPAFPQAVIAPIDIPLDIPEPMGVADVVTTGLRASAIPVKPPTAWFSNPQLDEPTPLTIGNDGRVFGHLALWDTCHIGFQDVCVTPPRSMKDYAYFHTGEVVTADDTAVRVGHITYNTGHAGATMGYSETAAHYDNTGAVAADIVAGEDEFGIWVAGGVRPGITDEGLRAVRSAPLSGDWRKIGGNLELVAALSVNVPGFAIVASAGVKAKEQVSLIAGGVKRRSPMMDIARELAQLKAAVAPLLAQSVGTLSERVNGPAKERRLATVTELSQRVNAG